MSRKIITQGFKFLEKINIMDELNTIIDRIGELNSLILEMEDDLETIYKFDNTSLVTIEDDVLNTVHPEDLKDILTIKFNNASLERSELINKLEVKNIKQAETTQYVSDIRAIPDNAD